jgi:hypothetical protein
MWLGTSNHLFIFPSAFSCPSVVYPLAFLQDCLVHWHIVKCIGPA